MRIALIPSSDLSYNSGSVIYAKNLFKYLHSCGHEAYLLSSTSPSDIPTHLMRYVIINSNILEHPIIDDRTVTSSEYVQSLSTTLNYLLDIHKDKPLDIVHAHYASFGSFAANIANGLINTPYVVSCFGRDINIGINSDHRINWFFEHSLPQASYVIASDDSIKSKIEELFPSLYKRIECIPMPFDNRIFDDGDLDFNNSSPIISSINSCFSYEKGIDTIINAFSKIAKNTTATLYIAGQDDHPDQVHYKRLLNLVEKLGIHDRVVFTGYLTRQNVGTLLKRSCFLVDARTTGNFSSVLLEAMFTQTPVVASNTVASSKIIRNQYNGFNFEPSNIDELAKIMQTLLSHKVILDITKAHIIEWLNENGSMYSSSECFSSVLEVYQKVLNTKTFK